MGTSRFLSSIVALSIAAFSPLAARGSSCSPNFEGADLRLVDSISSLQLGSSPSNIPRPRKFAFFKGLNDGPDWQIRQTGEPVVGSIITDIANTNLAVSALLTAESSSTRPLTAPLTRSGPLSVTLALLVFRESTAT
ncbi:hypothetical protein BDZ89DRAFT_1157056 [Hymenopellis radicata]|nr:hypothetical protein BDZ89DRAFT_1157056 [Hymenopellis radicata]